MAISRRHSSSEDTESGYHISIPQFSSRNWTPFLVILLIVAAFLLGSLWQKLEYLQKGSTNLLGSANAYPTSAPAAAGQAQPSTAPVVANVDNGHLPAKGDPNAKVKIVEFADLRCPFCQQWYTQTLPQIQKDYIDSGKAVLYFRHYDFLGPASTVAADAAECANEQNHFWDFIDYMYKNQPPETDTSMFTADKLAAIAQNLGMDHDTFQQCVANKTDDKNVTADFNAGQKAGVSGTPTFYVNGTQLVGAQPYTAFQQAINAALNK